MTSLFTSAQDAANALRRGEHLDVDVDTAVEALAIAAPHLHRHIDPTSVDGRRALANFRMIADRAGLPHDHPVFAGWFAVRALRVQAGDAIECTTGCPVTSAILTRIGAAPVVTDGWTIAGGGDGATTITITDEPMAAGEAGAFATPAGVIRVPGSSVSSPSADWASALTAADQVSGTIGRRSYDSDPDAIVELDHTRPVRTGSVDADSIHEDWIPEIAFHEDLQKHPSTLIQSATLATVEPPVATYRPRLTRRVIRSGRISDAQFEFIVAAGQAHSRHLPGLPGEKPQRVGIFLADGTGAGKTNEMLGIVMDNRLRGRLKAILVLEKRRHLPGFVNAWASFGCDVRDFVPLWDLKAEDRITATKGILVLTYSMLRDYDAATKNHVRVSQIAEWAGEDFQGPMLLDEAQAMRNAAANDDPDGWAEVSMQGVAGIALQDSLPDARVVYGSATGATDVHNLGYATRLGIWGPETSFKDRRAFISCFERGDIGDLEQVTLSLKASGVYVARSISYEGVEVVHLPVTLTNEERSMYNAAATMWARLLDGYRRCAQLCGVPVDDQEGIQRMRSKGLRGAIPYSTLTGIYEANRKNSMANLIAAFKARGVIADAKRCIEEGQSVVIQMQNTYEAQLNRALDRCDDATQIRLEPAELLAFAELLPTEEYEKTRQPHPTQKNQFCEMFTPKLDRNGDPVVNAAALNLRNMLVADARSIQLPLPPLDQIMLAFGKARVAEVTGRSQRIVPDQPYGTRDGATGIVIEKRTEQDRADDMRDFHAGTKVVLAFSTGAGGSSLGYHAQIGTGAADRRRRHYLIQLGHRADEVTQGTGRSHRSDQTMPPEMVLVTVDLPADRLFASRIVSSLFKLGALTQGHRHATSNGMFDERDCLDGPYASKAWKDLQEEIRNGLVRNYTWENFMEDMGLNPAGEAKIYTWGKAKTAYILDDPNKLINRVAALTDRRQQLIFDRLRELIDARIEQAMSDGTFNAGPETLKATSLTILTDRRIQTDRIHGGNTRILRVRRRSQLETVSFGDAYKIYLRSKGQNTYANFCKHRTTGAVALIAPGKPIVTALGDKIATNDIITPTGTTNRPKRFVAREPWMPFANWETLEGMWNAAVEASPKESTSFVTMVADALLPVWPQLERASGARNAVYRMQSDDGRQVVGRPISAQSLPDFCASLDATAVPDQEEIDDIVSHLRAGAGVALASTQKEPHLLTGDWTNGRLTGVSVRLAAGCRSMPLVLDALPGAGNTRSPGAVCVAASRPKEIGAALSAILAACPAIFVEDGTPPVAKSGRRPKTAAANANTAQSVVAA